jgi:transcriptional regulator with XRE-family HTH domain
MTGKVDSVTSLVKTVGVRLRQARRAAGLSVVALADRAGVGRATLTQLEAGGGNPTLDTLYALANALSLPLATLIEEPAAERSMLVLRHGEGVSVEEPAMRAVLLSRSGGTGWSADLYALTIPARSRKNSAPHPLGTTEHLHVHSGVLTVGTDEAAAELGPGDYARFDASQPHHYAAGDNQAHASLLIVSTQP